MPSVESIMLMTIIETKIWHKGRRSKCATFFKLSALAGPKTNQDLYRLQSYIKWIYHGYKWRVVLKQLNYPISMHPILFIFVDRIVNDHQIDPCRCFKFTNFFIQQIVSWRRLTKKRQIININELSNISMY